MSLMEANYGADLTGCAAEPTPLCKQIQTLKKQGMKVWSPDILEGTFTCYALGDVRVEVVGSLRADTEGFDVFFADLKAETSPDLPPYETLNPEPVPTRREAVAIAIGRMQTYLAGVPPVVTVA